MMLMADTDLQKPGQTVKPAGEGAAAPREPAAPANDAGTAASPESPTESQAGDESMPASEGLFTDDPGSEPEGPDQNAINWTASEFIAHEKSLGWYAALAGAAVLFAALVYLISRDFVSVGVVLVAALLLGIYGSHKPKQIEYRLDFKGITVGPKRFNYGEFRSFAVMEEGAFSSIVFMPLKRFAVPTTIYYPPEAEDDIVGVLSEYLPMEERNHDAVDRLMHRIRY